MRAPFSLDPECVPRLSVCSISTILSPGIQTQIFWPSAKCFAQPSSIRQIALPLLVGIGDMLNPKCFRLASKREIARLPTVTTIM